MLIKCCKKNYSLLAKSLCAGVVRSPFVLTKHISSYRYSIRKGGIFIIYMYVWRYVCHNSSACHVYVMKAELGHSYFLYVPAVSNVVTNGNGMGTKRF